MATLVKIRLNSQVQDLAYHLDVSSATISRIPFEVVDSNRFYTTETDCVTRL